MTIARVESLQLVLYNCTYSVGDDTDDGISALRIVIYSVVVMCIWSHYRSLWSLNGHKNNYLQMYMHVYMQLTAQIQCHVCAVKMQTHKCICSDTVQRSVKQVKIKIKYHIIIITKTVLIK